MIRGFYRMGLRYCVREFMKLDLLFSKEVLHYLNSLQRNGEAKNCKGTL